MDEVTLRVKIATEGFFFLSILYCNVNDIAGWSEQGLDYMIVSSLALGGAESTGHNEEKSHRCINHGKKQVGTG